MDIYDSIWKLFLDILQQEQMYQGWTSCITGRGSRREVGEHGGLN